MFKHFKILNILSHSKKGSEGFLKFMKIHKNVMDFKMNWEIITEENSLNILLIENLFKVQK